MGLFTRSIPDEDWIRQVLPLYEAAHPLALALALAVRQEQIEEQIRTVQEVVQKFPVIYDMATRLPRPTSAEACEAKKNFELALKDYADGSKLGGMFFRDLARGLGERLNTEGFSARAAAGRFAFQKRMFEEVVKKGENRMNQASHFFSRQ